MGKNRSNTILIIVAAIVLSAILYFALTMEDHYVWTETYDDNGEQPYDLSIFKYTLRNSSKEFEELKGLFVDTTYLQSTQTTLIYIGGYALLDSVEIARLKRFAENGNSVFISSRSAGSALRYLEDCELSDDLQLTANALSERIKLSKSEQSVEISFDIYNQPTEHSWIYFSNLPCYDVLGTVEVNGKTKKNLISREFGEGKIVIHSNPMVFTNYHMIRDSVFNYVNEVLGSVEGDKYWYLEPAEASEMDDSARPNISESPLRFILSHPPLKWAWYLIILITVFYVINNVRRKQRAIPVQKLPKNQTAEYLDMIYRLFRKEGKHKDIIQSQIKLLQAFLKNKYGLNAHKQDDDFFELASTKLKLEKKYLEQFFKLLDRSKHNSTLNDSDLLEVDREITEFYQKCP